MKKFILSLLLFLCVPTIYAQNNLLYNPMLYNPAIAGQDGVTNISLTGYSVLTELQSIKDNGQTLNFSMPLKDGKFGIGGNVERNEFSYNNKNLSKFNGFFAYHRDLKFGKLSLGASGGVTRDYMYYNATLPPLPVIFEDYYINLGLGAMLSSKNSYLSISSPNIFNKSRFGLQIGMSTSYFLVSNAQAVFSGGLRFPVFTDKLIFRPSFVITQSYVKFLSLEPLLTHIQLSASLQLFEAFWLNTTLNKNISEIQMLGNEIELGVGYQFKGGYRLGINLGIWEQNSNYDSNYVSVVLGKRFSKGTDYNSTQALFF